MRSPSPPAGAQRRPAGWTAHGSPPAMKREQLLSLSPTSVSTAEMSSPVGARQSPAAMRTRPSFGVRAGAAMDGGGGRTTADVLLVMPSGRKRRVRNVDKYTTVEHILHTAARSIGLAAAGLLLLDPSVAAGPLSTWMALRSTWPLQCMLQFSTVLTGATRRVTLQMCRSHGGRQFSLGTSAARRGGSRHGAGSHWRDCHSADTPSPCLLKYLPQVKGGAAR